MKSPIRNNLPIIDLTDMEWRYTDSSLRPVKASPYFIDDDIDEFSIGQISQHKTGVHARLDTPIKTTQSQGIFAQTKTKVIVPVGHRIVVSNLQPSVTQDDIRVSNKILYMYIL